MSRFFLALTLMVLFSSKFWGEEDKVEIPVEVTVDSYLTVLLKSEVVSTAFSVEGQEVPPEVSSGGLNFGEIKKEVGEKLELPFFGETRLAAFSSTHMTRTHVKLINNSKPVRLALYIQPYKTPTFILDLKQEGSETPALHVKVSPIKKITKEEDHLVNPDLWVPFPDLDPLIIYDSKGAVTGDEFDIYFALIDLSSKLYPGEYGGVLYWTFYSD